MLLRWAGPMQQSSGGGWQRQSALCAAVPLPWWPEADQVCLGTLSPLGLKCSVDSSLITAHLVIWSSLRKQHVEVCEHKQTLVQMHMCIWNNEKLLRKTMCLSSLLQKTGCPAVAPHPGRELKCQSVTAIVKSRAKSLASTFKRLEGLVKSEQKTQFWADRTRSCLGFHWPCPPNSPVAVKLSGLLWASSNTCLREPAI